ncbi:MAG: hypothetical protein K9J50_10335 [Sulfuritalea sp.]|jgi:hypothetical protein|nr:hypothetical protein [Sulfuritalea sp.]
MKAHSLGIAILIGLFGSVCWGAETGHCAAFAKDDDRYHCTALAMKSMSLCSQISTTDGINYCKAMTGGSSGYCEKISGGFRARCLSGVRAMQRKNIWSQS